MKSIMLSQSDITGGAFIAAYRTHQSLTARGVHSRLWVNQKSSDDWTVSCPNGSVKGLVNRARPALGRYIPEKLFKDSESTPRSYNLLPSSWVKKINQSNCDLIHLQWYNSEMLSIKDVANIKKPTVQTLHDMWTFCGAEHYTEHLRWREGYKSSNKPNSLSGFDIDQYIWKQKAKHWTTPRHLVAVSQWLADCVASSALLSQWPVSVIPNPIDTTIWCPMDKTFCRELFNLPLDKTIITFGALGGAINPRKGYDLLLEALKTLNKDIDDIHVVVFGQSKAQHTLDTVFPTTYLGRLNDQYSMAALNNAADVFVSSATQEAFGQTSSEAQACGLPVVAFDQTGSVDIVEHKQTGYLAQWSNSADLADGIKWTMEQQSVGPNRDMHHLSDISRKARERAVKLFSYDVVGAQYVDLYTKIIDQ